jgi:uncharacterized phage protein (TIGR01671 family)
MYCGKEGRQKMYRDNEFRGKDIETGEWAFGSLLILEMDDPETGKPYRAFYIVDEKDNIRVYKNKVNPETVGQYTGLKDKNGVKIFEGDILECERCIPGTIGKTEKFRQIVYFDYGQFYALQEFLFDKYVIGNPYDNPDLIGGRDGN